ncbi:hypothetical protein HDE_04881 [Halotydeus destructor]|nr:hypothetical protein HDE_04881 [Halotydeus destructor]
MKPKEQLTEKRLKVTVKLIIFVISGYLAIAISQVDTYASFHIICAPKNFTFSLDDNQLQEDVVNYTLSFPFDNADNQSITVRHECDSAEKTDSYPVSRDSYQDVAYTIFSFAILSAVYSSASLVFYVRKDARWRLTIVTDMAIVISLALTWIGLSMWWTLSVADMKYDINYLMYFVHICKQPRVICDFLFEPQWNQLNLSMILSFAITLLKAFWIIITLATEYAIIFQTDVVSNMTSESLDPIATIEDKIHYPDDVMLTTASPMHNIIPERQI